MKFIKNDKYYSTEVYEWNLPTGHSCPFAKECLVKVDKETGLFENSSNQYRCYAASAERFPGVREMRWRNYEWVKKGNKPIVPRKAKAVRIHASGDFFNQAYFDLWLNLCIENPRVEFWAFTKSLNYWVNRIKFIPKNLVLTASKGGKHDKLIEKHNLKYCTVVKSIEEGKALGGRFDWDDDEARKPFTNFLLLDNDNYKIERKKELTERKQRENGK